MASISVDLDTLDSVRYKMRSFLVGSPTVEDNSIQLDVPKEPSSRRESGPLYIPAYRLFETKKYNGPLVHLCQGTLYRLSGRRCPGPVLHLFK